MSWHGTQVGDPDWTGQKRTLAFQLHGWRKHGRPVRACSTPTGNGSGSPCRRTTAAWHWKRLVDTNLQSPDDIVEEKDAVSLNPGDHYIAAPRSTVILISPRK